MQIQVIGVSKPEWKEKGKAKWQEVVMTFVTGGKTQTKKFLSFDPIFNKAKEVEANEQYEVSLTKDGEFWKWTAMEKLDNANGPVESSAPNASKAVMTRPSTYETAEERAKKQVYIIRQSSLANAIEYSKSVKALKSKEEVFSLAQEMVDFILNEKEGIEALLEMEDDIPK